MVDWKKIYLYLESKKKAQLMVEWEKKSFFFLYPNKNNKTKSFLKLWNSWLDVFLAYFIFLVTQTVLFTSGSFQMVKNWLMRNAGIILYMKKEW